MPQLVRNIISGQYRPISSQYSTEIRDLVRVMLMKESSQRPGINAILGKSVVRSIISGFLDNNEHNVSSVLVFGYICIMHVLTNLGGV